MKFSEKLQNLRKEKRFSQEQLADMLDVSRQSVSKWESGQTYPEMDKLLQICKIFDCTLDDLTNDEVKEVTPKEKKENYFSNLVDEVIDVINRSAKTFKKMTAKQIVGVIFELVIVCILISLLQIPISYITDAVNNIFANFNDVGKVLSSIWESLIQIILLIFTFIVLFYTYKSRCLDRYENIEVEEQEESEEKETEQTITRKTNVSKKSSKIFDVLAFIFMFCIKIWLFFISLPIIFSFFGAVFCLALSIICILNGALYFGIPLMIMGAISTIVLVLDVITKIIFNKKIEAKKLFITLISSIAVFAIGAGITTIEFANTTFVDSIDNLSTTSVITKEYDMVDDLNILTTTGINYVADPSLKDKIKIEASYYNEYSTVSFEDWDGHLMINNHGIEKVNFKKLFDLFMKDLHNKEIHNYGRLFEYSVTLYTSQENIDKLLSNEEQRQEEENSRQNEINDYETRLNEKDIELEQKDETINELETENETLKQELSNIKETIKSISE